MAQPYIGEIRMFAGTFAPAGWAFCSGQKLPISENETLFQLIGTTYWGDGQNDFGLPDLQSRIPIHRGTGPDGVTHVIGEKAGTEQETLTIQQIPSHTHPFTASTNNGTQVNPGGNLIGASFSSVQPYVNSAPNAAAALSINAVTPVGGSQPHENTQPFLCINYIISLFGLFPSPT